MLKNNQTFLLPSTCVVPSSCATVENNKSWWSFLQKIMVFSCGAVCCSVLQCQCCSMLQVECTVIMVSKVWFTDCIQANVDTSNVLPHIILYIVTRQAGRIVRHIATHLQEKTAAQSTYRSPYHAIVEREHSASILRSRGWTHLYTQLGHTR